MRTLTTTGALGVAKACFGSDLSRVAELGVLWLNASLTVRAHKAGSHSKKGWESFTAEALRQVLAREDCAGIVFMAWGLSAQKTCDSIGIDEVSALTKGPDGE